MKLLLKTLLLLLLVKIVCKFFVNATSQQISNKNGLNGIKKFLFRPFFLLKSIANICYY